jgi:hypothetical protein
LAFTHSIYYHKNLEISIPFLANRNCRALPEIARREEKKKKKSKERLAIIRHLR